MDFEALLRKYLAHVRACEGTVFIEHIGDSWGTSDIQFSTEEIEVLSAMDKK